MPPRYQVRGTKTPHSKRFNHDCARPSRPLRSLGLLYADKQGSRRWHYGPVLTRPGPSSVLTAHPGVLRTGEQKSRMKLFEIIKRVLLVAAGLMALLIIGFIFISEIIGEEAILSIKNISGKTVISGVVGISSSKQVFEFSNLKSDSIFQCKFNDFTDGSYEIQINIGNSVFIDSLGYVTHNSKFNDTAFILNKNDSIQFEFKSKFINWKCCKKWKLTRPRRSARRRRTSGSNRLRSAVTPLAFSGSTLRG